MGRDRDYVNAGWTGAPEESDFQAYWALVRRSEMFDGRAYETAAGAAKAARAAGMHYAIVSKPSARGCTLYRVGKTGHACMETAVNAMKLAAEAQRARYQENLDRRVIQLLRVSTRQPSDVVFDLAKKLTPRILAGTCEGSGVPIDLRKVSHARSLAVIRRDPSGTWIPENMMVVSAFYARIRGIWGGEQAVEVIEAIRSSGSAPRDPPEEKGAR